MAELQNFADVCLASLPVLTQSINYLERPTACGATDSGKAKALVSMTPLIRAESKLKTVFALMKCKNLPLKAGVLLKVSQRVLRIFDGQNLLASKTLVRPISAVRTTLDSVVVMATELSKESRKLVLRVWTLQSQVKLMQKSQQAKVLSEAFTRGSEFVTLAQEYAVEKKIFTQIYSTCKNMTGVHFLV